VCTAGASRIGNRHGAFAVSVASGPRSAGAIRMCVTEEGTWMVVAGRTEVFKTRLVSGHTRKITRYRRLPCRCIRAGSLLGRKSMRPEYVRNEKGQC